MGWNKRPMSEEDQRLDAHYGQIAAMMAGETDDDEEGEAPRRQRRNPDLLPGIVVTETSIVPFMSPTVTFFPARGSHAPGGMVEYDFRQAAAGAWNLVRKGSGRTKVSFVHPDGRTQENVRPEHVSAEQHGNNYKVPLASVSAAALASMGI